MRTLGLVLNGRKSQVMQATVIWQTWSAISLICNFVKGTNNTGTNKKSSVFRLIRYIEHHKNEHGQEAEEKFELSDIYFHYPQHSDFFNINNIIHSVFHAAGTHLAYYTLNY